jgi:type III secretion protein HrpB1
MRESTDDIADELVAGMVDLLWCGARLDALPELQALLGALGTWRTEIARTCVVIAWWHVRARAWREALDELRRIERAGGLLSLGTALTAVCLYALGDPAWRGYARAAAYEGNDPMAAHTAKALLAAPEPPARRTRIALTVCDR